MRLLLIEVVPDNKCCVVFWSIRKWSSVAAVLVIMRAVVKMR